MNLLNLLLVALLNNTHITYNNNNNTHNNNTHNNTHNNARLLRGEDKIYDLVDMTTSTKPIEEFKSSDLYRQSVQKHYTYKQYDQYKQLKAFKSN